MSYVSPKAVLQEAGLWNRQVGDISSGTINGTNTVFTTTYKPLVQNTDAGTVTEADVTAYVDGAPVTVASLNATTGALTLLVAPSADTVVTADYAYSAVAQSDVAGAIEEAEALIDEALSGVATIDSGDVPPTVRKIARYYAAGLLMSREYGLEAITEDTTKEGKRKLEQAEEWLADYRARSLTNTNRATGVTAPRATADKRLFEAYDSTNSRWDPPTISGVTVQRES